jgi:hydroxymethylpyrimidine pyrophosphatase-like HAD family hydrolase
MKSIKYYKVYVFDLDNTLYLHKRSDKDKVHKEVKKHLETLKSRGKRLYVATHNKYSTWSKI